MSFENLNLIQPIQRALKNQGYQKPTPIQKQSIPIVLDGRDLLGSAQTGTGKTAAFAIPILQSIYLDRNSIASQSSTYASRRKIRALIVTPTRELAIQIKESFSAYGKHTGLRHAVIYGGVSQNPQTQNLRRGVDILVATPGRLLDLMNQGFVDLSDLSIFVLDEADRMLDMGFIHDIRKILKALPTKRQSLFFSATMPPAIVQLSASILHKPVQVEITPEKPTVDSIRQSVYFVDKAQKRNLLLHVLDDQSLETVLVFTRTKYGADKLTRILERNGIRAAAIHGNKSQATRQRALRNFKDKRIRVLVASDIAARGIDIDQLSCVINYEIPNISETYIHRIGRTGRAGAEGVAISFCDREEKAYLEDIQKLLRRSIPVVTDNPFPMIGGQRSKPVPTPKHGHYKRQASHPASRRPKWKHERSNNTNRAIA